MITIILAGQKKDLVREDRRGLDFSQNLTTFGEIGWERKRRDRFQFYYFCCLLLHTFLRLVLLV